MASEKSLAIVLRVVEFSETSCVVTLYTREFGKIGALAKGARRPKSPFEGALDVLALCRIVFLHKSTDALDLLTEARLERRFRAASTDLRRLYCGYYFVELLSALTDEHDPSPELFDLSEQALRWIEQAEDLASVVLYFELHALQLCGHFPELQRCVVCGREFPRGERVSFALLAGGAVCDRCRGGQRKVIRVSRQVIETLERFVGEEGSALTLPNLPELARGELRAVMNQYVAHVLGRPPRLRDYLAAVLR